MFLLIILTEIVLILIIKQYKCNKMTKRVMLLYSGWTIIILIISMLNLYGLIEVSDKVYALWLINIVATVFTILFLSNNRNEKIESINKVALEIMKSKVLLIFEIILMILLMYYRIKYNNIIASLSLEKMRIARFSNLFSSGIESTIFSYIIINCLRVLLIISTILIVNKNYINKITILTLINLILYVSIGYGRMIIFEYFLYLMFAYLILKPEVFKVIRFKQIISGCIVVTLCLIVGALIIVIRINGINNINFNGILEYGIKEQLKQLVVYFTGGFRALNTFINNGFDTIEKTTMGKLTFAGVDDFVSIILNMLGYSYNPINDTIGLLTQKTIIIGTNIEFNAFYTCIMNFYSDFGYIGIFIFPVIHGILVVESLKNYLRNKTLVSYILVLYVLMNLISSIYRWNYQMGQYLFLLIILLIINKMLNRSRYNGIN